MSFRMGLACTGFPADGNCRAQLSAVVERAADSGCRLVVFPENHMCPKELTAQELRDVAEPLDGPFMAHVRTEAARLSLTLVVNLVERNGRGAPSDTVVVVSDAGEILGLYRKCHLYDAHGVRESDRMQRGDALFEPVRTPVCTLGVGICYDLRFPEVARIQALRGADVLVFPAAWHKGPEKREHWECLLRARAIENEVFCCGCCHGGERYVGSALVADPLGRVVEGGPEDGSPSPVVVCDLDLGLVHAARDAMPVLSHRRPTLYGPLSEETTRI